MKNYSKMVEKNKQESREKIDRAINAIREMLNNNEQVIVCDLVRKTGLSRAFFYKNKTVHNALEAARKKQEGKVFMPKQQVIFDKAMEKQLSIYLEQIEKLRYENQRLEKERTKIQKSLKKKELDFIKGL